MAIGALCALFRMRRFFFSMVALRQNSCTFVLRVYRRATTIHGCALALPLACGTIASTKVFTIILRSYFNNTEKIRHNRLSRNKIWLIVTYHQYVHFFVQNREITLRTSSRKNVFVQGGHTHCKCTTPGSLSG